jgi:cyanate permease
MRRNFAGTVGLVVLTALFLVGGFFLHLWFLTEHCYGNTAPGRVPAPASVQGQFCGEAGSPVSLVLLGFEAAAVIGVIGLVRIRREARDWMGKLGAWLVPIPVMALAWALLTLPSDQCSDSAQATQGSAACATHSAGRR